MNRNGPLADYYYRLYQQSLANVDQTPVQSRRQLEPIRDLDSVSDYPEQSNFPSQPVNIPARRTQNKIDCQNCGKNVQIASLSRHMKSKRCMEFNGNNNKPANQNIRHGLLDLSSLSYPTGRREVAQPKESFSHMNYDDSTYEDSYDQGGYEQSLEQEEQPIELDY